MTDREERQHVIKVLQNMVDWMESINYIVATPERRRALEYAIASIKTDLKYDLLYEETIVQADKPTPKIRWDKDGACPICGYFRQWDDDAFCGHCGMQLGEVEV